MKLPWPRAGQLAGTALLAAALIALLARPGAADYFVSTVGGIQRFSDTGALLFDGAVGESIGGLALGPDGLVYMSTNDLGFGTIYRFHPASNSFVDAPLSNIGFNAFPLSQSGPMAFGAGGDLFTIATNFDGMSDPTSLHVTRIDSSGNFVALLDGAIADPYGSSGAPLFTDLTIRSNGDLFVAKSDGSIQRHSVGPDDTTLVDTLETGVTALHWMAFGPDGLLYLREAVNNSIIRYDVDAEAVVDTFVPSVPFTDLATPPSGYGLFAGGIFFGPGGDLLAVNNNNLFESSSVSHLVRLDGGSGDFENIVASNGPGSLFEGFVNHGLYVPVPEPGSAVLVAVATLGGGFVRGRRSTRPS